jgi:ClpP class serine protease
LPKVYLPGLGEFMQVIQMHHAKLWLAAKARNWPLAEYQLSEMKEVLDEVREMVPTYKNVPVGQMVDAIATGPIGDLEKAVEEKKFDKFAANYDKLTEACNSCHMAASRGFIKIRRPARSTFENQDFRPARR